MDTQSNNFKHYFVSTKHDSSEFFKFKFELNGKNFEFTSCSDVFSKNNIDEGSLVLIKTILKHQELYSGKILDMSCGYGAIGVILSAFLDATFDMCDINTLALELCKINAQNNNAKTDKIFVSDMWQNIDATYDAVVSNPPIKVGKKVLLDFLGGIKDHLNDHGSVTIVIKKNLGADSTKKYLKDIFGNCEILCRDRGYYILKSTKE